MAQQIQIRRDTAANWASVNPTPAQGELCFETDTEILKIGDGSTAYSSLAARGGGDLLSTNNLSELTATASTARSNLGLVIGTNVQAHSAVLDATTASFTTADESKLDAIEAGADVTDATNVAAAGAVMETDTSTALMLFVVDEDDMGLADGSDTKVPTQQSVKAYVDFKSGKTLEAVESAFQPLATVLTNTTASYTTAEASKLSGIEAAADVTDATNVAAAGAVMESDTTTALMSFVIDEDNMATDSATKVPTQQSVKAYADLKVAKATFPDSVTVALSDMTTQITTGATKAYWVNPFDTTLTVTKVKATLATAGSGATVVDINEGAGAGTSILSTKITIDASTTDSDAAGTPPVVSDASIAADGRLTFDIDTAGTSAAGLMVTLLFTRAV